MTNSKLYRYANQKTYMALESLLNHGDSSKNLAWAIHHISMLEEKDLPEDSHDDWKLISKHFTVKNLPKYPPLQSDPPGIQHIRYLSWKEKKKIRMAILNIFSNIAMEWCYK